MRWRWLTKKSKRDRSEDWNRHYRVAQRLKLRLDEAADKVDLPRVKVLAARIRHVRDIQIRELGR